MQSSSVFQGQLHLSFNFSLFNLPLTGYSKCLNKVTVVAAGLATAELRCGGSISGSSTVTGCSNSDTCSANTKYT